MEDFLPLPRRRFLVLALSCAGLVLADPLATASSSQLLIPNVTGLYTLSVAAVVEPQAMDEIVQCLRHWRGKVCIGGGRYSMGGQCALEGALHIDMRRFDRLVGFDPARKWVRVQSGMRWRTLQEIIDPHNLSVTTMQSYANFTIGGSVSVNAHGRYMGNGPVGNSVLKLQIVLGDGRQIEASRQQYPELFAAAIGGYGAVGVITEVELALTDNVRVERIVDSVPLDQYADYFRKLLSNDGNLLHNADLVPPHYDTATAITWRQTADTLSVLPWAKEAVFSFVLYYKQRTHLRAQVRVGLWTRELIDHALAHGGRYYLPYQLHATEDQFRRAYPEASRLWNIKRRFDPDNRFSNELWKRYL